MAGNGVTVIRQRDARAFLGRAEAFLAAREAEHNLLLGIAGQMVGDPHSYADRPYLATAERGDAVVAAAMMTPPYNLQLSLVDDPRAVGAIATNLRAGHDRLPGVTGPVAVAAAFAERWVAATGQSARTGMAQRIHRLERVEPMAGLAVAGAARRATAADRALLIGWTEAFLAEALGETSAEAAARSVEQRLDRRDAGYLLWEDGAPFCMVGYSGPTPNGIRIAPVYTPPALRGRGYASAATAAASQAMLDSGRRFCVLSTDLANPTANRVYARVGYRPVLDVAEYRFG